MTTDQRTEPGVDWGAPVDWWSPIAIPKWVAERAKEGGRWAKDKGADAYDWWTEEPETLDRGFDELDVPELPPDNDGPSLDPDPDPGPDPESDPDPDSDADDDGFDFWDWGMFGFGLIWAGWEIWQWLGTDPAITLWEDEITLASFENGHEDDDDDEQPTKIVVAFSMFVAPRPYAARVLDPMAHGGVALPGPGSPDVFIGGLPALRSTDQVVCPVVLPVPHTPGPWLPSQSTVLVNGVPALRAGDFIVEAIGGPNPIVMGEPTVEVGLPVPPVLIHEHHEIPVDPPWYDDIDWPITFRWDKIELFKLKGKLHVGLSQDGPFIGFEGQVDPIHIYGGMDTDFDPIDTPLGDVNVRTSTDGDVVLGRTKVDARLYISWWDIPKAVQQRKLPKIRRKVDWDFKPVADPKFKVKDVDITPKRHD